MAKSKLVTGRMSKGSTCFLLIVGIRCENKGNDAGSDANEADGRIVQREILGVEGKLSASAPKATRNSALATSKGVNLDENQQSFKRCVNSLTLWRFAIVAQTP